MILVSVILCVLKCKGTQSTEFKSLNFGKVNYFKLYLPLSHFSSFLKIFLFDFCLEKCSDKEHILGQHEMLENMQSSAAWVPTAL